MSQSQSAARGERPAVATCDALDAAGIAGMLARFGVNGVALAHGEAIPGSYWGAPEAGLVGNRLYYRTDTPVHSLLHELAHYVCMDPARRAGLDTDAGGSYEEECAVCYLEVLLAGYLRPYGPDRCLADMDAWGYSFREGTARAWFVGDGSDARAWLFAHGLVGADGVPTWMKREMGSDPGVRPTGLTPGSDPARGPTACDRV